MSRRGWAAFAAMSVIWGIPYLFIAIAVRGGVAPYPLAFTRVALGALLLLAAAARAGTLRQLSGHLRWLLAYAAAEIWIPFPAIAFGEQHAPSSVAAITIAAVPLIIAVMAMRFDHAERPTRLRAAGLLIGFAGVIALVGLDGDQRHDELLGIAAVLAAAVGYATGPMIIKHRLAGLDARATMGASLGLAALLLVPEAALQLPTRTPTPGALLSLLVLGVVCTALAFVIFTVLIRDAGPARASIITYVNPVVALALGVTLLGESLSAGAVAGLLLILAGSWLSTGGRLPPPRRGRRTARTSRAAERASRTQVGGVETATPPTLMQSP
jgi:drug/metabolite transporter (DMT)-like permease